MKKSNSPSLPVVVFSKSARFPPRVVLLPDPRDEYVRQRSTLAPDESYRIPQPEYHLSDLLGDIPSDPEPPSRVNLSRVE